ncbi:uncharacterized protein PV07_04972 [Cladophialophora immunda]|uniref:Protein kinase domain-containing protein n=1 Tax=Cladophialophora immunda TaxID=569365 RepID=A0A0D1ZME7_9EURO|nr:uncharacterized protein PV07_04972 [Cladophialophora immunda]KIW29136.1 hypothetical protein PV07_04972 [Cladophialophora immunda]
MRISHRLLCFATIATSILIHKPSKVEPWACNTRIPRVFEGPSRECHCPSPIFSTKHLGEGTSGVARKLSDTASGQIVVVKTHGLRHEDESEEAYLAFIQNEYRTASSLWHPNIVETYDIYQDEHEAWHQVMEPLAVRLDRLLEVTENASWDIIDSIFSHIVQGIAHMHSLEIAHMDIKVENIGISAAGAVKIFDFGSAHPILGAGGVPNLAQGIHGTLPYLAPEILKNTPYSPAAADVWALAILYIRISTGQFPWEKARLWDTSFRMFCRDDAEFKPTSGLRSIGDLPDLPIDSKSMRGPANVLELLPRHVRPMLGRMLDLDPASRPTVDELVSQGWIKNSRKPTKAELTRWADVPDISDNISVRPELVSYDY